MHELLTNLTTKIWTTRGCRFIAAKRYEMHDRYSAIVIAALSVFTIGINLIPFFYTEYNRSNRIGLCTIILSMILLSVSQYIYARDYKVKSLRHHACARELSNLLDNGELLKERVNLREEDIIAISEKYNSLLDQYENHKDIDLNNFYAQNMEVFISKIGRWPFCFLLKLFWLQFCEIYFGYFILGFVIPILSVLFIIF